MLEWSTEVYATWLIIARDIGFRLLAAWLAGFLIALIAKRGHATTERDSFQLTLILMCILIAIATQTIGDSIARAFSLVGALSIVRFRTAVPATRDVAFVLAAVVIGMAVGADQYIMAIVGLTVVASAAYTDSLRKVAAKSSPTTINETPSSSLNWRLSVETSLADVAAVRTAISPFAANMSLVSAETIRSGSAMESVFRVAAKPDVDMSRVVAELAQQPQINAIAAKLV